ncbi:MAG: aminotransferase class I/II-fold pyridoxal phosphate-dependent enzyme [Acidobacteriia bacterium]|nr:aminotransferase class I/II-fold pyridoxal phosphate-dependent enzyme [Terriglobia bacterium]
MPMTTQAREILAALRLENVRYAIRDLAVLADEVAKRGKKILPLNIGDPLKFDFATPPHMIEAVHKAMRDGHNGYAPSLGIDEGIKAIAAEAERAGISNVQSIFITAGVSEGVELCLSSLCNSGENVLTPAPEYPLYSAVLAKIESPVNAYYLDEDNHWEPDLDEMASKITAKTRGIVVINPNNPTGAVYSRHKLEQICELARRHNLVIFADEIYDKLILDDDVQHISLASLAPDVPVVTFSGLSKPYLAPGWRVGWAICSGPKEALKPYIEGVHKLLRARLCSNGPMQYAIKPALEGPQDHLQAMNGKLRRRRDLTVQWANSTPRVSCVSPKGTFYAFPKLDIPGDDLDFVKGVLTEKQVLVVHGSGFGQKSGTKHFRIVFLPDEQTLTKAYAAMADYLREHYK